MKKDNGIGNIRYTLTGTHINELVLPEPGVAVVSPVGDIRSILDQFQEESKKFLFTDSLASTSTGVEQNFRAFSDFGAQSLWTKFARHISESLRISFEELGQSGLFKRTLDVSDLTLQYYPQSTADQAYALSPHRDQSGFINLVVVLLVAGPSAFFICKDRTGTTPIEPMEIKAIPGDLVVMRAGDFGQNISGQNLKRPCHFVGRVEDAAGRMTLALRQISNDETRVQKLECFFGRKFGPGTKVPH